MEVRVEQVAERIEKVWIPKVPKDRIKELAKRIKPVIRFSSESKSLVRSRTGRPYKLKSVHLFNQAYTWDPKPSKKAPKLRRVCDIKTHHAYGYYGFFKPSIAEVLAQIPAEHLRKVIAFEIVEHPETITDLARENEALLAGYHVARTRLYSKY